MNRPIPSRIAISVITMMLIIFDIADNVDNRSYFEGIIDEIIVIILTILISLNKDIMLDSP